MCESEPLREKKKELLDKILVQVNDMTSSQKGTEFNKGYNLGFETAVDCAFERFKSAVECLIKFHEDIIEKAIERLETEELGHAGKVGLFITIRDERENIMVIEHWLEDAI